MNPRVEVREYPDRVLVAGVDDWPPILTSDLRDYEASVRLSAPLGDRPVLSILTRKPVPRRPLD